MEQSLVNLKRSGAYNLFIDESAIPEASAELVNFCLIGQSRFVSAPFNTIVHISSENELYATFGKRDKQQERKGNYFILHALLLLAKGPIYMVNIRTFDDTVHESTIVNLSTNAAYANVAARTVGVQTIYDKAKFWKVDPTAIQPTAHQQLLNFATHTNKTVTIYVRPSTESTDYLNETIADMMSRYTAVDIDYMPSDVRIQDTMVDVYIFGRNLAGASVASNPALNQIVNADGSLSTSYSTDVLESLAAIEDSAYITTITGSLLPELLDHDGNSMYIKTLINAVSKTTGIFCEIDLTALYEYADHDIDASGAMPWSIDLIGYNRVSFYIDTFTAAVIANLSVTSLVAKTLAPAAINQAIYGSLFSTQATPYTDVDPAYKDLNDDAAVANPLTYVHTFCNLTAILVSTQEHKLITVNTPNIGLDTFALAADGGIARVLSQEIIDTVHTQPTQQTEAIVIDPAYVSATDDLTDFIFPKDANDVWQYPASWSPDNEGDVVFLAGQARWDNGTTVVDIADATLDAADLLYIRMNYGTSYNVIQNTFDKALKSLTTATAASTPFDTVTLSGLLKAVHLYIPVETFNTAYNPFVLAGVAQTAAQFVDGTAAKQSTILDIINTGGIQNGLLDFERYPFAYLLDAFKTYIEPSPKLQLQTLANAAYLQKGFNTILSLPFFDDFKACTNPYFKASPTAEFDPAYIPLGGNTALAYTQLFTMYSDGDVAQFGAFYGPELIYSDGITTTIYPASAAIALNFADKILKTGKNRFDIVAGETNGLIQAAGTSKVNYELTSDNLDALEPAGFNCIVLKKGALEIRGDGNARNYIKTALSNVSNVELLIMIAHKGWDILDPKVNKRNTASVRTQAKAEMDAYLQSLVSKDALESYDVVCDLTNNTADIRSNGYLIMDTSIYTADGIKIAVQRTKVKAKS
jgi:hypothetical protein